MQTGALMITLRANCNSCDYDKMKTISVNSPFVTIGRLTELLKDAGKEFKHGHSLNITDKIEVLA